MGDTAPQAARDDVELAELLAEVRRIEVQSRRLVTDVMAGGYSSVFRGSGIEFEEVREYVDGDDPRAVDWNVTARVGRPFIKTYRDERDLTVLFLLDLSPSVDVAGWGVWSARQTAARVCACLALSAVDNNDKVGLVTFQRAVERFVPPRKGVRHALRIVRDCLALRGAPHEGTELGPALEFVAQAVRRRAVVFVVSDFLSSAWQRPLNLCARHHDVIAVRILSPELQLARIAAAGRGLVDVVDPESGHEVVVDTGSAAAREVLSDRVDAWRAATEAAFRRAHVDRIDVAVPRDPDKDAVVRPILRFFRMRELREGRR